jgi:hypothetical protein
MDGKLVFVMIIYSTSKCGAMISVQEEARIRDGLGPTAWKMLGEKSVA